MADWTAVVVGLGAAIATTVVAVFAHRTSKRATEIADEATKIAAQQHQETVALRHGTAGILRSLLSVEISLLPPKLGAVLHTMRKANVGGPGLIADRQDLTWVLTEFQASLMPTAESAQDKLHNFEGEIGKDIADLIGQGRAIADLCRRFHGRIPWGGDYPEIILDQAAKDMFVAIRRAVKEMLKASLNVTPFFVEPTNSYRQIFDELQKFSEEND
ncbi:hypothetical protein IFT63_08895 [Stenotrophomonas sp. CFBP 13724]|uniref:hypothetical protein n=1 Tax=Stenotrophomonas sp. CFBP 13724 TaxID=2775298 RepID=UPI0017847C13|nr:hypothetical protein [Stenotrophomonas sp. CFBP 13724]MBD8643705.1 hypothetical protein [Stenotrophomonas sp. CFBP 13724]